MTSYTTVKVNISEGQKQKLQHAVNAGCSVVSIRLGHENLKGDKKIAKAYQNGKSIKIRMSTKQLKHNTKIEGGFLGMLAGLAARALPMIAKTVLLALGVGALPELASSGVRKAMGQVSILKKVDVFLKWKLMEVNYT